MNAEEIREAQERLNAALQSVEDARFGLIGSHCSAIETMCGSLAREYRGPLRERLLHIAEALEGGDADGAPAPGKTGVKTMFYEGNTCIFNLAEAVRARAERFNTKKDFARALHECGKKARMEANFDNIYSAVCQAESPKKRPIHYPPGSVTGMLLRAAYCNFGLEWGDPEGKIPDKYKEAVRPLAAI